MFHPVIVTLCFSVIYLISHIYPTSATLTLHHNCSTQSIINQTATAQFDSLNIIPISFILSSPRTQFRPTGNIFLSILILLSGDIQSNPGPISTNSRLNMCTLNIRSLTNPLHYTAVADLAESHDIHIFALTETWINPNTTSAQLFDSIPHGFTLISNPRPISFSCTSSVVGGGTAFLIREPFTLSPLRKPLSNHLRCLLLLLNFLILSYRSSTFIVLLLLLQNLETSHPFLSFLRTFKLLYHPYPLHHMTFSLREISTFMLMISMTRVHYNSSLF